MVLTNKQKFNKKYGRALDASNSLTSISKDTGIARNILQQVYNRGTGAYRSNPSSVRNVKGVKGGAGPKMSKEAWSYGRVYGFIMKNSKQIGKGKPDRDLWEKHLANQKKKMK